MFKKRGPTKQARLLYNELKNREVNAILEFNDGKKCVDIGIPNAHLYIEVDGPDHLNNPVKIEKDFERDHYSENDRIRTMHISNQSIDKDAEKIARAIAEVVKNRREKIREGMINLDIPKRKKN